MFFLAADAPASVAIRKNWVSAPRDVAPPSHAACSYHFLDFGRQWSSGSPLGPLRSSPPPTAPSCTPQPPPLPHRRRARMFVPVPWALLALALLLVVVACWVVLRFFQDPATRSPLPTLPRAPLTPPLPPQMDTPTTHEPRTSGTPSPNVGPTRAFWVPADTRWCFFACDPNSPTH